MIDYFKKDELLIQKVSVLVGALIGVAISVYVASEVNKKEIILGDNNGS